MTKKTKFPTLRTMLNAGEWGDFQAQQDGKQLLACIDAMPEHENKANLRRAITNIDLQIWNLKLEKKQLEAILKYNEL